MDGWTGWGPPGFDLGLGLGLGLAECERWAWWAWWDWWAWWEWWEWREEEGREERSMAVWWARSRSARERERICA